jgi:hypothetical protein
MGAVKWLIGGLAGATVTVLVFRFVPPVRNFALGGKANGA